jgi:hypothetical protein
MAEIQTRRCPHCWTVKPKVEFHKGIHKGASTYCKECAKSRLKWHRLNNAFKLSEGAKPCEAALCPMCKEIKPVSEFYPNKGQKNNIGSYCKPCMSKWRDKVRATKNGMIRALLNSAKKRAKEKGIVFNLTIEDIHLPSICPALGIELDYSKKLCVRPNSPSLDRRIPELGYVKGNVQVISHKANTMKSDASLDELRRLFLYFQAVS